MRKKIEKRRRSLLRESLSYIAASKRFIFASFALFLVSALIAFAFPENFTFFDKLLKDIVGQIEGKGLFGLIWFIFQNNVSSAFFALILGMLFGIFPIFNAMTNGAVLGYVFSLVSVEQSGFKSILYLLPHGIFELPAVFITLGLGIRLGFFAFAPKGKKTSELKIRLVKSLRVFASVVLPLLVIAAIIEGSFIFFRG